MGKTIQIELIDGESLQSVILDSLALYERQQIEKQAENKLLTINQVAKRLGRSHATISKHVREGLIKATVDNKISLKALNEYLKNK